MAFTNRFSDSVFIPPWKCHTAVIIWRYKREKSPRREKMNDPAFVDMLCISGTFFTIAAILVASVLFLERHG